MRFWLGIAVSEHVARGVAGGFCQLCHGKALPLRRMSAGDWIIYYSPRLRMRDLAPYQQFTAIACIADDAVYQVQMAENFTPWRRNVHFLPARPVAIHPLLDQLEVTSGNVAWGQAFRYGHLPLSAADFRLLAGMMLDQTIVPASVAEGGHQLALDFQA